MATRYFVRRDIRNGNVLELSRIVSEPKKLLGESWRGGQWNPNPNALRFVNGDGDADELSERDALAELAKLQARNAAQSAG